MKRDWRLIRDILLGQQDQWADEQKVTEHVVLCIEAGFVSGFVSRDCQENLVNPAAIRITSLGQDWADLLRSENRLVRVLQKLNAADIGPSVEVLRRALLADQVPSDTAWSNLVVSNAHGFKEDVEFFRDASLELFNARRLHAPLNSSHEAYAVILEEVDEFWEEVRKKRSERDPAAMRKELIQIAAMACRAANDVVAKMPAKNHPAKDTHQ